MLKKKTFLYLILVLTFLLLVTGCAGMADYSVDLPGEYSVVRKSAHQITIAPKTWDSSWGSDTIPTKVTELAWDDTYILAKQLGLKEDPNSSNGYQIPNKNDVHFWILEFKSGKIFGPFDEDGYIIKKNELGISTSVELKKIEDIK